MSLAELYNKADYKDKSGIKGKVFNFNSIDCSTYAPEFYRILKDGSHCYVMTNHINLIKMLNTFTDLRTEEEIRGAEAVWLSLH